MVGGALTSRPATGIERSGRLVFDHPYAAVALNGSAADFRRAQHPQSDDFCLPLFTAWVTEPQEPG